MPPNPEDNVDDGGHAGSSRGDLPGQLRSVREEVATMESALAAGNMATGLASANGLVTVTTEMLELLDPDRKLGPGIDAELLATLRVYRNAAFAFRKLAGANGEPDPGMRVVCAATLEQGHELFRALMSRGPEPGLLP